MGDNTWIKYFPNNFLRHFEYDSFDISDMHTIDDEVSKHIFKEIEKSDWNLIIAHFLTVDHIGHYYGLEMDKLEIAFAYYSKLLQKVYDSMDDDTVLVVIGDHGMNGGGLHGG